MGTGMQQKQELPGFNQAAVGGWSLGSQVGRSPPCRKVLITLESRPAACSAAAAVTADYYLSTPLFIALQHCTLLSATVAAQCSPAALIACLQVVAEI